MEVLKDIIIVLFLVGGIFFFLVGTIGLIRMPDVFCRMHATGKSDTLGVGLVLLSLMIHHGFSVNSLKLLIIIAFIWITNPTAGHIIAKTEWENDNK